MDIGSVQGKGKGVGKERGKGGKDSVPNSQQWQGKQQWQIGIRTKKGGTKVKERLIKEKAKVNMPQTKVRRQGQ